MNLEQQKQTNSLPPKAKDHTGKRFGFLTVKSYAGQNKYKKSLWVCVCNCGKEVTTLANALVTKSTTSCGLCTKRHYAEKRKMPHRKTPIYRKYWSMIDRCCNKSSKVWDRYGGRGITVCDRWKNSFDVFLEDMGFPPPGTSLDRIDNNKGYSPDNCRWATMKEQQRNRRDNRYLEHNGEKLCITDWGKKLGVSQQAIQYRLKNGYLIEDALTKPFRVFK